MLCYINFLAALLVFLLAIQKVLCTPSCPYTTSGNVVTGGSSYNVNPLSKSIILWDNDPGNTLLSNVNCNYNNKNPNCLNVTVGCVPTLVSAYPSPPAPPFTVFPTGDIYSNAAPNFNAVMVPVYTLTINCNGNTTSKLYVYIKPAPYFSNLPNTVRILETLAPGTIIFTASASELGPIKSIGSPPWSWNPNTYPTVPNPFSVDLNTGDITFTTNLDYCKTKYYEIPIVVRDDCGYSRTSTLTVSVVQDCLTPDLNNLPAKVHVLEGVTTRFNFFTATNGPNANGYVYNSCIDTVYSILAVYPFTANWIFWIDPKTGQVFYAADPGFSHPVQVIYSITIKVTDICGSDTEVLTVEIDATTPPSLNVHTGFVSIYEQQNNGFDVPFYWYATTEDSLCQSQLVWSISGSSWFSLAATNDHLQVAQWISYSSIYPNTNATVTITVKQNAGQFYTDTLTLTVNILPINHAPVFSPKTLTTSVTEQQVIGTAISGNAVATDTDVGDTVTYTLIPALYSNYFTLTAPPLPHLLTSVVFDYATMPITYKMQVRATDKAGAYDTFTYTINITPKPTAPVFSPSSATIKVKENQGGGYVIPYTFGSTTHIPGDTVQYSLFSDSNSYLVTLNTVTNQLSTTTNYVYMTTPSAASFNAYIQAKELAGGFVSTFTLTVSILPVNQAPVFATNVGTANIVELQPMNTALTPSFLATDPDGDTLTYTLATAPGSNYFHISTTPAPPKLYTSQVLVYASMGQTSFTFQITAMDAGGLSDIFTMYVNVLQTGQAPVFSPTQGVVSINEQLPAGTDVDYNIIATGQSTLTYSIVSSTYSGSFTLQTSPQIHLQTAVVFNYEAMGGVYALPIYVKAVDLSGKSATFTLTVNILDVDEAPVFTPASCMASVAENKPAGTNVGCTINAVDPESLTVTYTLTPYSTYFVYDPSSGKIETTMPLYINQMSSSVQTLTLTAYDPGLNKATYSVTITVTKANLTPVFTPPAGSCSILEKQSTGLTVPIFFAATDPDNEVPTYSMVPSTYSSWFTIVTTPTPHLETTVILDYNTLYAASATTFNVQVRATNPGGLTSTFTCTITVLQVNVAPVFNPVTGTASISEGQAAGLSVPYNFAATDANVNDVVSISLQYSPYSYLFTMVQSPSPHLETTQLITYSQLSQTVIPLTIQATDKSGLYSTFTLTVTITAINHPPTYTPNFAAVAIKEQLPVGTTVPYNFAAKDVDIGATISYSMLSNPPYSGYFTLVTSSQGYSYLSISSTINYASLVLKTFVITVRATDNTGLYNDFQLGVTIIMVNQAPVFNPTSGAASINEGQPVGTTVPCNFLATQVNGEAMLYTVVPSGNNPYIASFNLVKSPQPHLETTVVFVYSQMLVTTFSFMIYATVSSTGLYATFLLTITVLPVTTRPPVFSPFSQTISMDELLPVHTAVSQTFEAIDPNPGSTVSYSLASTAYSNYFNLILTPVAHLEVALPIDYSTLTINPIALQIIAKDNQNAQTATFTLYINIIPAQKPPVFNITSPAFTTVNEQSAMGTWLPLVFTCTDPNAGDTITYTISSSTEPIYFKVVALPMTHLEVNAYITYDDPTTPANVDLVITAMDSTQRTAKLKVTVNILGVNRLLILSSKNYQGSVSGDGPEGTQIVQASYTCLDKNRAANLPVKYSLADVSPVGSTTYFAISSKGAVTLVQVPPLSMIDQTFKMNLTVQDAANPAIMDWAYLTVIVTPGTYHYNPGNLTFSQDFYNFEIRDDAKINDYAGAVLATRGGDPAPFLYQMGASRIVTSVDQTSGVLSVAQTLASTTEYVQNVDVVETWKSPSTSQYTSFRLDTYSAAQYLIDFIITKPVTSLTQANLLSFLSALTVALHKPYPDAYPRLVYVNKARYSLDGKQATTTKPVVKSDGTTNITVVVLKGTYTDSVTSLNIAKQYYSTPDVQAATLDKSGKVTSTLTTPLSTAGFTVKAVMPFIYSTPGNITVTPEYWLSTPTGNVVIGVLAAVLATALFLAVALSYASGGCPCCCPKEAAMQPSKKGMPNFEDNCNDMNFKYKQDDHVRAFRRYDPQLMRNPTPPAHTVMNPPTSSKASWHGQNDRPNSSLTDVDSDYHSTRPESSTYSLSDVSLHSSMSYGRASRHFTLSPKPTFNTDGKKSLSGIL